MLVLGNTAYNLVEAMQTMNSELAQRFARSTLSHVGREYPNGLSLVLNGPTEVTPSGLHPMFYGSFDWHSCVHGWWQLMRLARLFPEVAPEILGKAEATFTVENGRGEIAFLEANSAFERPYGWGWFLALHGEVSLRNDPWKANLDPIAASLSQRFKDYLPRLTYPVRTGTHSNTAFALNLAHQWAKTHDHDLALVIAEWAMHRFKGDVAVTHQEPSGEDFLSPTLTEALLMARVLPDQDFRMWFTHFMPELPDNLLTPVTVSDRSDGRIGHLDGLHLSRAWCWRNLAPKVSEFSDQANQASESLMLAALPHLEANYMSEHWLCSFALLAMTDFAEG